MNDSYNRSLHNPSEGSTRIPSSSCVVSKSGRPVSSRLALFIYVVLFFAGLLSQSITMPLWIDSNPQHSCGNNSKACGNPSKSNSTSITSPIFISHFSSFALTLLFGLLVLVKKLIDPSTFGPAERRFPHYHCMIYGLCYALVGILLTYSSSATRTPPSLQVMLSNFQIPAITVLRYILMKKLPNRRKTLCCVVIIIAVVVSLLPTFIPALHSHSKSKDTGVHAHGLARILWPIGFITGMIPIAFAGAYGEKIFQDPRLQVNLTYFFFLTMFYQNFILIALFWVDIVPGYGTSPNIKVFWGRWLFGFKCFFGLAGCHWTSTVRGTVFILGVLFQFQFGALALRYGEGALFLAVINTLVTPAGFLFWTLFKDIPPDLVWSPVPTYTTWFSLGALVIMVPAIVIYSLGDHKRANTKILSSESSSSDSTSVSDTDPLIINSRD